MIIMIVLIELGILGISFVILGIISQLIALPASLGCQFYLQLN